MTPGAVTGARQGASSDGSEADNAQWDPHVLQQLSTAIEQELGRCADGWVGSLDLT